jgi:phosphoribosyl-AMP cyclohydrolase
MKLLDDVQFDVHGLIPAIAQDEKTGDVLMMAWMNRESLEETLNTNRAVYFSRSRKKLWRKGEESGNVQVVKSVHIDCDADVILLRIDQVGDAACHTGHRTCFYREVTDGGNSYKEKNDIIFNPKTVYKK